MMMPMYFIIFKVDVIVNTTSPNLVLSNGAVSSLILQAAGPSLQTECTDYVQKVPSLAIGEIAVTKGYNLSCRHIYHGSCIGWDNGAGPCEQVHNLSIYG